MLQIIKDEWIDSNGYMTLNREAVDGLGAGNLLLHTGLYYTALARAKLLTPELCNSYTKTIRLSEVKPHRGLYWRSIYKADGNQSQQHDDYIGISAGSYFCNKEIAQDIMRYGEATGFIYDSKRPLSNDVTYWHDRFLGLIDFYRLCSGKRISIWSAIPLAARALALSFTKQGDSAIFSYLFFSVGLDAMPLVFWPFYFFSPLRKLQGSMFAPYLGEGHPLTQISI